MPDEKLNIQHLQQIAVDKWKSDQSSAKDLGAALIAVRDAMKEKGHGEFTKWCHARGMAPNRVNYCMQVVEGKRKKKKTDKDGKPADNMKAALADQLTKQENAGLRILAVSQDKTVTAVAVEILKQWISDNVEKIEAADKEISKQHKASIELRHKAMAGADLKLLKLKLAKHEAALNGEQLDEAMFLADTKKAVDEAAEKKLAEAAAAKKAAQIEKVKKAAAGV